MGGGQNYTAMVTAAPLRERRWALLARAQYQAGHQTEALRSLRRIRIILQQELGLDPGPELMALEQSVVMGIALVWVFVNMLNESEREAQREERYEVV